MGKFDEKKEFFIVLYLDKCAIMKLPFEIFCQLFIKKSLLSLRFDADVFLNQRKN